MASAARYQTNGIDIIIDALVAANDNIGDLRERLWQVTWSRSYQDILVPLPVPDIKIEGHVVFARQMESGKAVVLVDTGEELAGIVDTLEVPPMGARARLVPVYGMSGKWVLRVNGHIGCGLSIRFDEAPNAGGSAPDSNWIDRMRACLSQIRENEVRVRKAIEAERRTLPFIESQPSFRSEMEKMDKELRQMVLAEQYTDEERRQLAKAKTPQQAQAIIASRNKRLVDRYREEVLTVRAKIPEMRAEYDKKMESYAGFRTAIDRLNNTDSSSRAITDASLRATKQLDAIESASFSIRASGLSEMEENPRAHFGEIINTLDLLFELVPPRLQRLAQSNAATG